MIIGNWKIWFGASLAVILAGVGGLVFWGLRPSIDFVGGSLLEVQVGQRDSLDEVKANLESLGLEDLRVSPTGEQNFLLRAKPFDQAKTDEVVAKLAEKYGSAKLTRFETVGPIVSKDLQRKAVLAVILASVGIVLYVAYAFRGLGVGVQEFKVSSWRFGLVAIVALLHDVFITVGSFSLLGKLFDFEVDMLFVSALLTVMGFSVHDTIVVFDRLRENLKLLAGKAFAEIAEAAVTQTIGRSLNTSLTVIFVLLSLLLLGGGTITAFLTALLVGVIVGTYSSIFVAAPLLVLWQATAKPRT